MSIWHDEDIESAVIGGIFQRGVDPEVMEVIATLPASSFGFWQTREIFEGICAQARSKNIIDPILLSEAMPKHEATILEASGKAWAKSSLRHYATVLKRNATLRTAEGLLDNALNRIRTATSSEQATQLLNEVQENIASLSTSEEVLRAIHINEFLPQITERLQEKMDGRAEGRTVLTGIEELDTLTGGLDQTDLVVLAARPSMGKTELVLNIIDQVTLKEQGVLFFSMEMGGIQIAERQVAGAGNFSTSILKSPDKLEDEDWARIANGIGRMTDRKIWIIDATDLTAEQIKQRAIKHKLEFPETALVAVDYVGLVKTEGNGRHDLEVGKISKTLKSLAKTNKTPVLALSQLSRGVESRTNKRPMNADLKNSGELEADADIIMMLYRDEVYNPEGPARGIAELNVTKNRNGALGTVYRSFSKGHFYPIDQAAAYNACREQPEDNNHRYSKRRSAA